MPYFVKIGAEPSNISGVGSRGYHIFRRGNVIHKYWGRVAVIQGRAPSFEWQWNPRSKVEPCGSEAEANRVVRRFVRTELLGTGYTKLPPGKPIAGRRKK